MSHNVHTVLEEAPAARWLALSRRTFSHNMGTGVVEAIGGDEAIDAMEAMMGTLRFLDDAALRASTRVNLFIGDGNTVAIASVDDGGAHIDQSLNQAKAVAIINAIVDCAMPRLSAKGRSGDPVFQMNFELEPASATLRAALKARDPCIALGNLVEHLERHGADPDAIALVREDIAAKEAKRQAGS